MRCAGLDGPLGLPPKGGLVVTLVFVTGPGWQAFGANPVPLGLRVTGGIVCRIVVVTGPGVASLYGQAPPGWGSNGSGCGTTAVDAVVAPSP